MQEDYRQSHVNPKKGQTYDSTFHELPYRAVIWALEQSILKQIMRKFYHNRPVSHLDFACGTGRILGFLQEYARISVGIDISSSMLEVAREKYKRAELIKADITCEQVLEDRKFNLITAFRFFPNAQPELRREVMGKLIRHLDKDGCIVFNNHMNTSSSYNRLIRLLKRKNPGGTTVAEMEQLIKEHGLVLRQSYAAGVIPSNDKHMLLPGKILYLLERCMQKLGIFHNMAQDIVFVCQAGR